MKKSFKPIASLVMATTLIFGCALTTSASNSSVSYEGGAEKYVFLPGSEYTDSDLYDGFKDVMPGDIRQEVIPIQNDSDNSDYVKIYMRAEAHNETENPLSENVAAETDLVSMQDFLRQLSMTVWNGDEVIFQASPDELDGLSENVLLGEFEPGDSTELTVELTVPIELGNEYANRVGEVDWVFVAEELNYPEEPSDTVKTGDSANMVLWFLVMGITVLAIASTINYKRKMK